MSRNEVYELIKEDIGKTVRTYLPKKVIVNPIFTEKNCTATCISSNRKETGIKKNLNYFDSFLDHVNNGNYLFLLFDGSFVQFDYEFAMDGSKKKVSKAMLAYYPHPEPSCWEPLSNDPEWYKLHYDEIKSIEQRYSDYKEKGNNEFETILQFYHGSKYIRIDYSSDKKDHTEAIHPRCHIHIGGNNSFRLATRKVPLISEFLDLVLYLHYIKIWGSLNGKETDENYLLKHIRNVKNNTNLSINTDLLTELERNYCHFCI